LIETKMRRPRTTAARPMRTAIVDPEGFFDPPFMVFVRPGLL
jgi:hypothetical protein